MLQFLFQLESPREASPNIFHAGEPIVGGNCEYYLLEQLVIYNSFVLPAGEAPVAVLHLLIS